MSLLCGLSFVFASLTSEKNVAFIVGLKKIAIILDVLRVRRVFLG